MEGGRREGRGRKDGVANAQNYLFNIYIRMRKRRDLGQECLSINLDFLEVPEITSITLYLSGKAFITNPRNSRHHTRRRQKAKHKVECEYLIT